MAQNERVTGVVKFFHVLKGWGFVKTDDGRDAFVHFRQLGKAPTKAIKYLPEGVRVSMSLQPNGDKGFKAFNVDVVE